MPTKDEIFARLVLHNKLATEEQVFHTFEEQTVLRNKGEERSIEDLLQQRKIISRDQADALRICYERWQAGTSAADEISAIDDELLGKILTLNGKLTRPDLDDHLEKKRSALEYKDKPLARYLLDKGVIDEKTLMKIGELQRVRLRNKAAVLKKMQALTPEKDEFFIKTALQNGVINSAEIEKAKNIQAKSTPPKNLATILVEENVLDPILANNVLEAKPDIILVSREKTPAPAPAPVIPPPAPEV